MSNFEYKIAEKKHDWMLRKILRNNPINGEICVSFENEPNYFINSKIGNEFSETIICEDLQKKEIVALLTKSIKKVYINELETEIGYLNNLRVDKKYRNRKIISNAWKIFYEMHKKRKTSYYITSIIKDNYKAKQALLKKKLDRPEFIKIADYTTFIINLSKRKKQPNINLKISRAIEDDLIGIVDCLNKNGKKKQFYPYYKKEDFICSEKLKNFNISDFFIAKKNNRIVGVAGVWDQSTYKQIIIKEYRGKMRLIKPIYNFFSKILKFSPLPKINYQLKYLYLSFIAIDNNDENIFRLIMHRICNELSNKKYPYLILGLANNDPLSNVAKEFSSIKYESDIYIATYNKNNNINNILEKKLFHILS